MILNLFIREPRVGTPCKNCGMLVVEAKTQGGWFTFFDVLPDPLGTMHLAFYRGDNMEHLAHPPLIPPDDPQAALTLWRAIGERPLFTVHRCPPTGDTAQGMASLRRER